MRLGKSREISLRQHLLDSAFSSWQTWCWGVQASGPRGPTSFLRRLHTVLLALTCHHGTTHAERVKNSEVSERLLAYREL